MEKGRVTWFDKKLGYGFISRDSGDDIFVHFSKLIGLECLEAGQLVTFEVREVVRRSGGKKLQAFGVRLSDEAAINRRIVRDEISV